MACSETIIKCFCSQRLNRVAEWMDEWLGFNETAMNIQTQKFKSPNTVQCNAVTTDCRQVFNTFPISCLQNEQQKQIQQNYDVTNVKHLAASRHSTQHNIGHSSLPSSWLVWCKPCSLLGKSLDRY